MHTENGAAADCSGECVFLFEASSYWGDISQRPEFICVHPTCFMAVTVITKKRGRPLVTGLVGVSMMSCKEKGQMGGRKEGEVEEGTTQRGGRKIWSEVKLRLQDEAH